MWPVAGCVAAAGLDYLMNAQLLVTAMASLSRTATEDFTVAEILRALSEAATVALRVDGAGVMRHLNGRNAFEHSSGAYAIGVQPLERLQEVLQAGPCADAITGGSVIVAEDLRSDGRWVEFQQLAADLNVGAMIAVPLISRGRGWGVLDLYRQEPRAWTAEELQAAQVLADVAVSYLVMAHDRDVAREAQQALAHRAMHDDLTGLPNRALLFDRLNHALAAVNRTQAGVAVVFLDLDLFKGLNDTFGHTAADAVLVEISYRLRGTLRGGDTLSRFAGDEFVIICEGLPQDNPGALRQRVASLTSRLQRTMQTPIRVGPVDVVVSASIGVAITTEPMTGQELLSNADDAMYTAKQRGPGRVSIRDHVSLGLFADAHQLERDLAGALQRGELRVHYQPIVHADTHHLAAVEALLRWQRPHHGMVPAAVFAEVAVRTGLIVTIGRWVIAQACQQMAAWQQEVPQTAPRTVYINLSAGEIDDDRLMDTISTVLADTGLSPRQVGFEIVEEDLSDPIAVGRLHQLHERGHPLSVDDFGTGYSSLSRLLDLPAAVAKLDKSVIDEIPQDPRRVRFVDGVLHLADTLDLQVIAEGVENHEQAEHLSRVGCPLLQGHYFAQPQAAEDLTATWSTKGENQRNDVP